MRILPARIRVTASAKKGMPAFSISFFSLNRPGSAGTSFVLISENHPGWVQSPVPKTVIPLNCGYIYIQNLNFLRWPGKILNEREDHQ